MAIQPAAVGLCLPTLVADLTRCSEEQFDAMARAASWAGVADVDMFASHLVQVARQVDPASLPSASSLSETIGLIRDSIAATGDSLDDGSVGRLAQRLTAAGTQVRAVEVASCWAMGDNEASRREADHLVAVAELLGAPLVVACCVDPDVEPALAVAGLGALADRAAASGRRVCVEWLPYAGINHFRQVDQLIRAVGRPNVGFLIDAMHWHYQEGGPDWAGLAAIEPGSIFFIQLSDAR
ncbi:MAG: TIM barrel protein, partial [Acidimicrobiales bacterium]|nr:TIM barrel protein [Acidimicrobiales bacterium]